MKFSRRKILRATGVSLALPTFEAFRTRQSRAGDVAFTPRRMVCICAPLGFYPGDFFPKEVGRDYTLSPYLRLLAEHRDDFTVISGLSGIAGGHQAINGFLTGISGAGQPGIQNGISIDQFAAQQIGNRTRFSSLVLSAQGLGLSWTRTGARVPAYASPSRLFAEMFLEGTEKEKAAKERDLEERRSVLDDVLEQAKAMRAELGGADRKTLDEYLASIRDLEKRLSIDEQWVRTPKPVVNVDPPTDITDKSDLIGRTRLLFRLAHLAIRTDSTRLITIMLSGNTSAPPIDGVTLGHHDLSHHGKDPGKLAQLRLVETECMKVFGELVASLKQSQEDEATLLDRTMVYLGSNLGDASSHSNKNLPIVLAGGGFTHGSHLSFGPTETPPLCNLYVSMLRRLGIEVDKFNSSSGSLPGLESSVA